LGNSNPKCVVVKSTNQLNQPNQITNYLTIDVEDYYQVSAFEDVAPTEDWEHFESRVKRNTNTILDLLDEFNTKATFFIVGWIAERHPGLTRQIAERGHQVECHSYLHRKVYDLSPEEFHKDTEKAKNIIEDITGKAVTGYRAPSYSITKKSLWALDILQELGFQYDSSIFPILHDTYGIPDAPRYPYTHPNGLKEYPISTVKFFGKNIPASGGGYFRLFPYWLTKILLTRINNKEKQPFTFYLHPWEVDPNQPRFNNARAFSKFRHYNNLHKTKRRMTNLLHNFTFGPIP